MNIDIYRIENKNKYLSVPAGTEIPTKFADLKLTSVKTNLTLNPSQPLIALDQNDVIKQISETGYATHETTVEFNTNDE